MEDDDKAFDAMVDANIAEIERLFGKKAAERANVGWADTGEEFASKVYGKGIVSTRYNPDTYEVEGHDFHGF